MPQLLVGPTYSNFVTFGNKHIFLFGEMHFPVPIPSSSTGTTLVDLLTSTLPQLRFPIDLFLEVHPDFAAQEGSSVENLHQAFEACFRPGQQQTCHNRFGGMLRGHFVDVRSWTERNSTDLGELFTFVSAKQMELNRLAQVAISKEEEKMRKKVAKLPDSVFEDVEGLLRVFRVKRKNMLAAPPALSQYFLHLVSLFKLSKEDVLSLFSPSLRIAAPSSFLVPPYKKNSAKDPWDKWMLFRHIMMDFYVLLRLFKPWITHAVVVTGLAHTQHYVYVFREVLNASLLVKAVPKDPRAVIQRKVEREVKKYKNVEAAIGLALFILQREAQEFLQHDATKLLKVWKCVMLS